MCLQVHVRLPMKYRSLKWIQTQLKVGINNGTPKGLIGHSGISTVNATHQQRGGTFSGTTSGQILSILASALQVVHLRLTTHHSSISTESLPGYDSRNSVSHKWLLGMNLVASWYDFKAMQQQWCELE